MCEKEYQRIINRVAQSTATPMISSDVGLEATQQLGALADAAEIDWALAGGLAMYLYGSPRMTKDVDVIASDYLSLTQQHPLSFGGSSYSLPVGKYDVQVDWTVRKDAYARFYQAALREAVTLPSGLRIITPEWLVILKYNAGRQKDLDDIVFLLRQKDTVDRPTVKQKVVETAGEGGWLTMLAGFRRLCDLADGNTKELGKYYDEE